jgi:hypothetical protein
MFPVEGQMGSGKQVLQKKKNQALQRLQVIAVLPDALENSSN